MLSKVLEQWEFTNKCKEVALSMTYLSVITHTKSVLYKSMWKLIWKQTNIIVQKEKISCFFFNIRRETIFFSHFTKLREDPVQMFKMFLENAKQVSCGLTNKIFKSVLSESISINLSHTSKVTYQPDYIFLKGSDSWATLTISNFLHIPPPNHNSSFNLSSHQMIMSRDSQWKLKLSLTTSSTSNLWICLNLSCF